MPVYTYECEDCGHRFDIYQWISERPLETCPRSSTLEGEYTNCLHETNKIIVKCNGRLRRVFNPGVPTIIFNGPGFYVNDYKKKHV